LSSVIANPSSVAPASSASGSTPRPLSPRTAPRRDELLVQHVERVHAAQVRRVEDAQDREPARTWVARVVTACVRIPMGQHCRVVAGHQAREM
jgi:hypothetical protein